MAHLGVIHIEHDFIAWSHLLYGLQVYASCSAARQAVRTMMQLAITPADLLQYDGTTYVAEYVKTYEQQDIVIFDTETTGLDVLNDDVVQIAAIRVRQGKVADSLNIFIETSRPIPPMLGDIVNPLVEEYGRHPHIPPAEALQRFCDFAKGAAILGHNATHAEISPSAASASAKLQTARPAGATAPRRPELALGRRRYHGHTEPCHGMLRAWPQHHGPTDGVP